MVVNEDQSLPVRIEDRAELVMELRKRTFALARPEDIKGSNLDLHLREAKIKGGKTKGEE